LLRDYKKREEVIIVIRELLEEVCEQLRRKNLQGRNIHLSVGYSKDENKKGFSRQFTFKDMYSNDPLDFIKKYIELFDLYHAKGSAVRILRVAVGKLQEEIEEPELFTNKRKKLLKVIDSINEKHKGTIRIASSFTEASVTKGRLGKIGGHFKE
jgi:DNA polymerase V